MLPIVEAEAYIAYVSEILVFFFLQKLKITAAKLANQVYKNCMVLVGKLNLCGIVRVEKKLPLA